MTRRPSCTWTALLVAALMLTAAPPAALAQSETAGGWTAPRLADGRPDLQGVWDFRSITPLERPGEFADRERLTDEDEAALVRRALDQQVDRPPAPGQVGGYNRFWMDAGIQVNANRRTSLIVDPPDGRLPPLAPNAMSQRGSLAADLPGERPVRYRTGGIGADGPEDRGLAERCLVGFSTGPPVRPGLYNNNLQLFQTADHVVILNEMVHDVRIIPLDSRPHLPPALRQWMGDSRGRWEGDTLVVETTSFTDKTASYGPEGPTAYGSGLTLHLTERFSRTADDILLYEYTVNDPATFTQPFTVALHMRSRTQPIFEYACHEGNYGMLNILAGAREQERKADAAERSRSAGALYAGATALALAKGADEHRHEADQHGARHGPQERRYLEAGYDPGRERERDPIDHDVEDAKRHHRQGQGQDNQHRLDYAVDEAEHQRGDGQRRH